MTKCAWRAIPIDPRTLDPPPLPETQLAAASHLSEPPPEIVITFLYLANNTLLQQFDMPPRCEVIRWHRLDVRFIAAVPKFMTNNISSYPARKGARRGRASRHQHAFPRRDQRPSLARVAPNDEGAGNAGCLLHPRSRVQLVCKREAHEHTGTVGAFRHSLRNGLTAYAVLSPETNSSCLRRWRINGSANPVGSTLPPRNLTPATGVGTTRFCRTRRAPSSCAPRAAHEVQLTLRPLARRRCRVHRIPHQRP